ncbi:MAG TPA: D-erythronate dehydrogenase [Aestuariivirgaceae bacterium]|nr:D-erythronate dehydrogenase [Aestuariivirgaceae bacterium]
MKVVITGGTGFIGVTLARRLLRIGKLTAPNGKTAPVDEIVLFDMSVPDSKPHGLDGRVRMVKGEISDQATVRALIDGPDTSVFHLASVVSGGGEQDFDLAMRVNLTGNLNVLEAARGLGSCPRVVFASSIAVFGGSAMPKSVGDDTKQLPQTTYGATKAIGELLINDYSRKGYIDGRSARLPTVIVRPGKPNKAASSFVSGVFREPLNGEECVLPVETDAIMPLAGYGTVVEGFVRLHEVEARELGEDRAVNFPSLAVSVDDMIQALKRVAGNRKLGPIRVAPDPVITRIVATWPVASHFERARKLGLPVDRDLDSIVKSYIEDYLPG